MFSFLFFLALLPGFEGFQYVSEDSKRHPVTATVIRRRFNPNSSTISLSDLLNDFEVLDQSAVSESEPSQNRRIQREQVASYSPRIETRNMGGGTVFCISAEVPGVKLENLSVEIREDQKSLVIKGHREEEEVTNPEDGAIFSERYYGDFSRVLRLPRLSNLEAIEAELTNGVLKIMIPQANNAADRRRIEIKNTDENLVKAAE
eukprot:GHVL01038255.1.p1 GENE.GHVL01038255.1~~GHVL01038255.1.p1  ORF type:complete len:204 (+),score=35.58 GHVL01038255.1:12-623(+)